MMTVSGYLRATAALLALPFVLTAMAVCVLLILFVPPLRSDAMVRHTNSIWPLWQQLWKGDPSCTHHMPEQALRPLTRDTAGRPFAARPESSARSTRPRTRSCAPARRGRGAVTSRTR